jgi:hypothetical protein
LEFYEQKERAKGKLDMLDPHFVEQLKQTKQQLDGFVDGLIETLCQEFHETRITPYASRKEKIAYLRRLSQELDKDTYEDTEQLFTLISQHQESFLKASLGGKPQPYLPKPDLRFQEYQAIKNFYSGADFERNSYLTLCLPVVSGVLWFMQRALKKMRWL